MASINPHPVGSQEMWKEVLGYLNFSSGAPDPRFLRNLNALVEQVEAAGTPPGESAHVLHRQLSEKLAELTGHSPAFANPEQARAVLRLVFDEVLPAYREHHRDLLFHLSDGELLRPFFIGRVAEAVLAEGSPWDETARITAGALARLNDFIGHRPVAVLHSSQKIEPYAHERVRPIPLYIAGAGVGAGRYRAVVALALDLLRSTDRGILDAAWFDPELLDELALDPRAYDFNHPVNRRPNYHFGQWDPHLLDRQGRYRRFVLQQVTLDALLERVEAAGAVPREELLFEAATVLAGIILMASGTSGSSPQCHDSTTTLVTLLPQIAAYRDAFYRHLFDRLSGSHAERLQMEEAALHQPFAAARQHLNAQLARRRALQLQHVQLAQLFAQLGFPDAALRQVQIVPAVSARIVCQIHCLVTAAHRAAERGRLVEGLACITQIEDLLRRGIECGAIVDPWNILGFSGQFSLFPAVENSISDPRIDELTEMMERVFHAQARLWHQAAARHESAVLEQLPDDFRKLAEWWDQFATEGVSGVRWVSGREAYAAAKKVADALSAWHQAGASGGDLSFWRPYVDEFDSPQAYAWVIEALLERQDLSAAMALLVHWLSRADQVRLEEGPHTFHGLAARWMRMVIDGCEEAPKAAGAPYVPSAEESSRFVRRFFELLEANAESYWESPRLESSSPSSPRRNTEIEEPLDEPAGDDAPGDLYRAAYDEMVYRDSTADGVEGSTMEGAGGASDFELEGESNRISRRLAFLATIGRLWKHVATVELGQGAGASRSGVRPDEKKARGRRRSHSSPHPPSTSSGQAGPLPIGSEPQGRRPEGEGAKRSSELTEAIAGWFAQCERIRGGLSRLAGAVADQAIPRPTASQESLVEFDRRMNVKESLLEKIIATWVVIDEAKQFMLATLGATSSSAVSSPPSAPESSPDAITRLWQAVLTSDVAAARQHWALFLAAVRQQPLLYVRLGRGGEPDKIAAVRSVQQMFRELLRRLPRLGMLRETCQLIQTARSMERDHPLGAGAVTEFDRLFEIGFKAIVEAVVESSTHWPRLPPGHGSSLGSDDNPRDADLIDCLQHVTETLLPQWGSHSHTLRLSVLEKVAADKDWNELTAFIERYGHDLFTQQFFNYGNLRAILHEGVDAWIEQLSEDPDAEEQFRFIAELDGKLPRAQARKQLSLVIEAVVENYPEYRDYNATTTQSDRGEMLHTLLDFLRLKAAYDRIHWNLRPVTMVHEVLVRAGRDAAARIWRRAMARETGATADGQVRRLAELQKKYGMRLSTVADRVGEHFIRPLAIDRVRAFVRPAAEEARHGSPPEAFTALEAEASELAQEPTGAGLDLPDWLVVLEEEVDRACGAAHWEEQATDCEHLPRALLSWGEIQDQLSNWEIRRLEEK